MLGLGHIMIQEQTILTLKPAHQKILPRLGTLHTLPVLGEIETAQIRKESLCRRQLITIAQPPQQTIPIISDLIAEELE